MKTKEEILEANGYCMLEGYLLDYERENDSKDMQNILITKEECIEFLKREPTKYFWNEHYEYLETLEEAWESFTDNYLCDNDIEEELTDEDIIKRLS